MESENESQSELSEESVVSSNEESEDDDSNQEGDESEEEDVVERIFRSDESLREIELHPLGSTVQQRTDELIEALQQNSVVEKLTVLKIFSHEDPSEEQYQRWERVCRAIGQLENLKCLSFEGWTLDCRALLAVLPNIEQAARLELHISDLLEPPWVPGVSEAIVTAIRNLVSLEEFSCMNRAIVADIFDALSTLPNLRQVELYTPGDLLPIHGRILARLIQKPSIQELKFETCRMLDAAFCQEFSEALGNGTVTKLELDNCEIHDPDGVFCDAIVNTLKTKKLKISWCRLQQLFYRTIGAALSTSNTLEDFFLEFSGIVEDESLAQVFVGLERIRSIRVLSIIRPGMPSWVEHVQINDLALSSLQKCMEKNLALSDLCLKVAISDERWLQLVPFVRDSNSLRSLELKTKLSQGTLVTTAEAIASSTSLEILRIEDCDIHWPTLVTFIKKLRKDKTLKELKTDPPSEEFTDHDANEILAAVKENYALERIPVLDGMPVPRKKMIQTVLRLNESGRRYLIDDASSRSKGIEVLGRVADDIDCLFFHLLENPLLCDLQGINASTVDDRGTKRKADYMGH